MHVVKMGIVLVVLAQSLNLAIVAIMGGNWFSALAWILGCLAVLVCLLGISCPWDEDSYLFKGLAAATTMFAILAAISGSAATDSRRQAAQLDLMGFYIDVSGGIYGPVSSGAHKLADEGMRLCAAQRYVDIGNLANELQKAQHLGPGSSLAFGTYEQLTRADKPPLSCVASFVAFNRIAPNVAKIFLHRHPEVLIYK